jgi:ribosomal protein L2
MFSLRASSGLLRNVSSVVAQSTSQTTCNTLRTIVPSRGYAVRSSREAIASYDTVIPQFKTYKPITPGIRHLKRPINDHLYKGKPVRLLTTALRKKGGRNSTGRITVRSRGGGHRQRIRLIDFTRAEPGPYDVVRLEYDPGRSGHIALVKARDTKVEGKARWKYILAPEGLRAGDVVESYRAGLPDEMLKGAASDDELEQNTGEELTAEEIAQLEKDKSTSESLVIGILRGKIIKPGNCVPLRLIPTGTVVHNVALNPLGKAILVRSAGTFAQVVHHESNGRYSHVRLQSGELRKVLSNCVASIGKVSNPLWNERQIGKAGRNRWLGKRPHVRGVAMNACDHPHGGGRGKSKSDKHPVSIWGWGAKGTRTRKPGPRGPKGSNKMVLKERPRGKERKGEGATVQ